MINEKVQKKHSRIKKKRKEESLLDGPLTTKPLSVLIKDIYFAALRKLLSDLKKDSITAQIQDYSDQITVTFTARLPINREGSNA